MECGISMFNENYCGLYPGLLQVRYFLNIFCETYVNPVPELRIEKSKNCHEFYNLSKNPRLSLPQTFACCLRLGHEDVSKSVVTNVLINM